MTTKEDLEEIYRLPTVAEPVKKEEEETKEEEEWISICDTSKFSWKDKHVRCEEPAIANITLLCPFCGLRRSGKCEKHLKAALAEELCCRACSLKANTSIILKPVNCLWKTD